MSQSFKSDIRVYFGDAIIVDFDDRISGDGFDLKNTANVETSNVVLSQHALISPAGNQSASFSFTAMRDFPLASQAWHFVNAMLEAYGTQLKQPVKIACVEYASGIVTDFEPNVYGLGDKTRVLFSVSFVLSKHA